MVHRLHITVDVDWAPDWACADLAETLAAAGVRSTWFVTHASPWLSDARSESTMELGIHPNFHAGSSHGNTPAEVLATCMDLVPGAQVMRTHCLLQSTPLLQAVVDTTPVQLDSSIYIDGLVGVRPSRLDLVGGSLTRLPFVWEDDIEFARSSPRFDGAEFLASRHGADEITVVNLHPIHVALNARDASGYLELRRSYDDTRRILERDARQLRRPNGSGGAADFVRDLLLAATSGEYDASRPLLENALASGRDGTRGVS
jgi:hypothetical protein